MVRSEIKELKLLQCDLNDSLSLEFCLQSVFPGIVARDLHSHGSQYSQKTRDLLHELVFLVRFIRSIRLTSVVTAYEKIQGSFAKVREGRITESYWMKLNEAEKLLECINQEIFSVLEKKGEWFNPPQKWVEVKRILSEYNQNGEGRKKRVLLSVIGMKVAVELHNYLLFSDSSCFLSLRRVLHRFSNEGKTSYKKEKQVMTKVKNYLDGKVPSNWREKFLGFEKIIEFESEGINTIEVKGVV